MKVKEKKVELIELFYDLIYVYAISKLTMLIEEPENGVIPFAGFFRYLVVCFVILQAWLYLTNYVNRYGRWKWYEYGLTAVNMTAAVYMANTINTDWDEMATTFNLAMLVMLLCVAVLYFIQIRLKEQDTGAARNMLTILTVDLFLYLVAFLASVINPGQIVLWIDVAAVLVGAFLPFFVRGRFDISIISFPHLVERFELITIPAADVQPLLYRDRGQSGHGCPQVSGEPGGKPPIYRRAYDCGTAPVFRRNLFRQYLLS